MVWDSSAALPRVEARDLGAVEKLCAGYTPFHVAIVHGVGGAARMGGLPVEWQEDLDDSEPHEVELRCVRG
jgi:hypothetical protein